MSLRQERIETIIKFFNQSKALIDRRKFIYKMAKYLYCDMRPIREIVIMLEFTKEIDVNKWEEKSKNRWKS